MITKNIKDIKKVYYVCLTLSLTVLPLAAQEMDSPIRESVDQSVVSRSRRISRQQESLIDHTTDNQRRRYIDFHNSVINKYAKQKPELARHKILFEPEKQGPSLVLVSKEFRFKAEELKRAQEEESSLLDLFDSAKEKILNFLKK